MKKSSQIRASHVNSGTAIPREELAATAQRGREFRHPKLLATVECSDATAVGGLALAARLMTTLRAPQRLDEALSLLRNHRPFHESDHVLTHVYNLFAGGTCIEDIASLQQSEAAHRILGAKRVPDPTTSGDFLRRFDEPAVHDLDRVTDDLHRESWARCFGRKKQDVAYVDIDSHVHHVYGDKKEGTDFTYKGGVGYHPLVISLAQTQECLRLINRPGNVVSAEGAAQALETVFPLVKERFKKVVVRGDSAFASQDIFDACEDHDVYFAMVSPTQPNFAALAESIPEKKWKPFRTKPPQPQSKQRRKKSRKKRPNLRRKRAQERGKRDLQLVEQFVAEVDYRPTRSAKPYRLIIRRQRIKESKQGELFELWRYRYVLTNLPKSVSTEKAVRTTYERCDQENVIEQLQNGVAAMRMPTGGFLANWAYLACARIAHNMKAWLAMLALPREVMRWEWKRFRTCFVFVAARVIKKSRQIQLRLADAHRFAPQIARAIEVLQT